MVLLQGKLAGLYLLSCQSLASGCLCVWGGKECRLPDTSSSPNRWGATTAQGKLLEKVKVPDISCKAHRTRRWTHRAVKGIWEYHGRTPKASATLSFIQPGVGGGAEGTQDCESGGLWSGPGSCHWFSVYDSGILSLILGLYFFLFEMRGWIRLFRSFRKYDLDAYCVSVTIPDAGETSVNRIDKYP